MEENEKIIFDQKKIMELEQIILDKDKNAALKFLDEYIYKPIKKRKETHCKPPFSH